MEAVPSDKVLEKCHKCSFGKFKGEDCLWCTGRASRGSREPVRATLPKPVPVQTKQREPSKWRIQKREETRGAHLRRLRNGERKIFVCRVSDIYRLSKTNAVRVVDTYFAGRKEVLCRNAPLDVADRMQAALQWLYHAYPKDGE